MKILHVAPLWLPVGTATPGGIETFLAQLCRAQQDSGFSVAILASGDSDPDLPVVPVLPECVVELMGREEASWYEYYEQEAVLLAIELADEFDVVHSHLGPAAFAVSAARPAAKVVHTVHGQASGDLCWLAGRHPELKIVAVSAAQARPLRDAGATVHAVVHNGLRTEEVAFSAVGGRGLAFLGRMEWAKGADIAVEVAQRTGLPLRLAGPVIDGDFFDEHIAPALSDDIRYEGVVAGREKSDLLTDAACVLMPSRWNEPFGMVAIESMAAGTPVLALASGALPEIIDDGVTGFVCADADELVAAIHRVGTIDRERVRTVACERFDIEAVARRYADVYRLA